MERGNVEIEKITSYWENLTPRGGIFGELKSLIDQYDYLFFGDGAYYWIVAALKTKENVLAGTCF